MIDIYIRVVFHTTYGCLLVVVVVIQTITTYQSIRAFSIGIPRNLLEVVTIGITVTSAVRVDFLDIVSELRTKFFVLRMKYTDSRGTRGYK